MKLYYSPGACSLSPHIVLSELGIEAQKVIVDLKTKRMEGGEDFRSVNPRGYVPILQLDNGEILSEGPVIVQYLADQNPKAGLAPANGTMERYRLQEWLNFISSELHKQFSPLFRPDSPESVKTAQRKRISERFDFVVSTLSKQPYLMKEGFSVADPYLFTVLRWATATGPELAKWPELQAYVKRMEERPAVAKTLQTEREAKRL